MSGPRLSACLMVAATLALGARDGTASDAIPIWISNPAVAVPIEAPFRFGVPLPRGLVRPDATFEVRVGGERHFIQTAPLERWPDGTVRWLLADLVVPTVPGGRSVLTLERSTGFPTTAPRIDATAGPPLRLRSAYLSIDVAATGEIAVRLLRTAAPDVLVAPMAVDTGRSGTSKVTSVRIESSGPVRAEVVIDQEHPGGVTTETRLVAWAGSTTLLLRHRILNRGAAPTAPLRTVPVTIRVAGLERASILIDGAPKNIDIGDAAVRLAQPDPVTATSNGKEVGTHLDGAIAVHSPTVALTAVVPDFWQQYPKAFVVSRNELVVDLVAGGLDPIGLGIGAAKTHDVWLRLERPATATPLPTLARVFRDPPRALATPAWAHASGALTGVIDPVTPAAQAFLTHLRSSALRYDSRARYERWDEGPPGRCSARSAARPHTGFFGVLHWGDWNFPGYRDDGKECDAWGNLEYDLPVVFGLAWASTGDATWAGWFERALAHYRDVDVIHSAPAHPDWVGMNHPHKVGHFDFGARAKIDLGHVWLDGLLLHYHLTGDAASRDAMLAMAHRLADVADKAKNPRQFGWPMIALAAAGDAAGDPGLRDAALRYARLAMARFAPDPGVGDWKLGILASGLAAVHRTTGDDAVRDWLVRYGARLLADERVQDLDPRYLAVSGYLAMLTGDARYARLATTSASELPIGNWGKTLAMQGRVGFELLTFDPASAP